MSKRIMYKGIDNYYDKKQNKGSICMLLFIVGLGIFIGAILIGLKCFDVDSESEVDSTLAQNKIIYYIDISDEVSKDKAQVNWLEVAAINETLNNGAEDELVPKIAEAFLKKNIDGNYGIFEMEEVLDKLNVNKKEEEKINEFLKEIEKNTLYKDLYQDEVKVTFVSSVENAAINNYSKYGVLPSITIAQAILESGWGQSELAKEHNNLFGIKADSRWGGAIATIETKENYDDVITASFRKYDDILESVDDHGQFLYSSDRYRSNGLFDGEEYISQAQALEDAGYSTSKNKDGEKDYADKLISVIQKYNLMIFDSKVKK